jgi:hypothetical protein
MISLFLHQPFSEHDALDISKHRDGPKTLEDEIMGEFIAIRSGMNSDHLTVLILPNDLRAHTDGYITPLSSRQLSD